MNSAKDDFSLKVCWILHQDDYSLLREAEGCSKLGDLPTTSEDKENATIAARKMGIPDEEIFCLHEMSMSDINKFIRRETHRFFSYCLENKRVFLFVYCAGHGVADQ